MDILIVEDDTEIAEFLEQGLSVEGYDVVRASDAAGMRRVLDEKSFPLIILDRMLPDGDGVSICEELRLTDSGTMILMLTARDALEEKLEGLRSGADDYITKPFSFDELLVRLETLLRRAGGQQSQILKLGALTLDLKRKTAQRDGQNLDLTPTEFALLRCFAERPGTTISRMELLSEVWGKNFDPNTNIVEVYIAYLRKKLDTPFNDKLLRNVRGFGYMLEGF